MRGLRRLVVSWLWRAPELKTSRPLMRYAAGGWEFSGIWNWQSGFPISVDSGDDRALSGIGNDLAIRRGQSGGDIRRA